MWIERCFKRDVIPLSQIRSHSTIQRFGSLTQLALHEVPKYNLKSEASTQNVR